MRVVRLIFYSMIFIKTVFGQSLNGQIKDYFDDISYPLTLNSFDPLYHFPPVNQDSTYVCWSFATISFLEAELARTGNEATKLSVMYPVYFAFIEKARRYAKRKGDSRFTPGDLFPTVFFVIEKYGIVPEEAYPGKVQKSAKYNHNDLYRELENSIKEIRIAEEWDENSVIARIQKVLDKYLGRPPENFIYQRQAYTPATFRDKHVPLPWDDYLMVTSFMYAPFDTYISLDVPDNWRKIDRFFNVTLAEFYAGLKTALTSGYSVAINGDISEPGRHGPKDIAIIPDMDLDQHNISQLTREYRFKNGSTTDDHLMHIVGYQHLIAEDWFLVKDSWRDAWEGQLPGYFMYRGDFARLKILAYLVHKEGVPDISAKVPVR